MVFTVWITYRRVSGELWTRVFFAPRSRDPIFGASGLLLRLLVPKWSQNRTPIWPGNRSRTGPRAQEVPKGVPERPWASGRGPRVHLGPKMWFCTRFLTDWTYFLQNDTKNFIFDDNSNDIFIFTISNYFGYILEKVIKFQIFSTITVEQRAKIRNF